MDHFKGVRPIEAILEGRQPVGMTMAGLLTPFPVAWAEQRAALGA